MSVLDKPRVDYTLARGPLSCGAQLGAIGPIGLRPALILPHCPFMVMSRTLVCLCDPDNFVSGGFWLLLGTPKLDLLIGTGRTSVDIRYIKCIKNLKCSCLMYWAESYINILCK